MTSADFLTNGMMVDGRYELVEKLGFGAFGVVYKALDTTTSTNSKPDFCAIKILRKWDRLPSEIMSIRREVELHSIVAHHPNIVGVRDAFEDDDHCYIILDYHSGGDLFEEVCENETYMYDDELLRSAFLSLIDAVQACHNARIAHRDLKPENILISEDGSQMFLADFGLATEKAMCEDFGTGTPIYMAPECHGKRAYCPRTSDIWALGMILVNMISGINPWEQATLKDDAFAYFIDHPDSLAESLPISEGAHTILLRIFTMNPARRITLEKLRKMVVSLDTFFQPIEENPLHEALERSITEMLEELELESDTDAHLNDDDKMPAFVSRTSSPNSSLPSLSSSTSTNSSCDREDSNDAVITPEETTPWKPTATKGMEEIFWSKGSGAEMMISQ